MTHLFAGPLLPAGPVIGARCCTQVALDQLVMSPIGMVLFLTSQKAMEGTSLSQARKHAVASPAELETARMKARTQNQATCTAHPRPSSASEARPWACDAPPPDHSSTQLTPTLCPSAPCTLWSAVAAGVVLCACKDRDGFGGAVQLLAGRAAGELHAGAIGLPDPVSVSMSLWGVGVGVGGTRKRVAHSNRCAEAAGSCACAGF